MSVPEIREQESVFPRSAAPAPLEKLTIDLDIPSREETSTQVFQPFVLDQPREKPIEQESVAIANIPTNTVGDTLLQKFNVNELIDKRQFDIAEYFLGRPLTEEEKEQGLMSRSEQDTKEKKSTDEKILAALEKLVAATERKPAAAAPVARRGHDDEKKDEGDEGYGDDDEDGDLRSVATTRVAPSVVTQATQVRERRLSQDLTDVEHRQRAPDVHLSEWQNYKMTEDKSGFSGRRSMALLTGELKTKYPHIVENVLNTLRPDAKGEMVTRSKWSAASQQLALAKAAKAIEEEETKLAAPRRPSLKPELRRLQQNIARLVEPEELPDPGVVQLSPESMQLLAEPTSSPAQRLLPDGTVVQESVAKGLRGRPRGKPSLRNEWVPFGKWRLAINRLKNEDVLALGRNNGEKIPKHPNRPISAALKVALMQQVKGETVSMDILSEDDREFLDWLFQEAHITFKKRKPVPLKPVRTPKQIKDRLSVLYGEIAEGPNDNPKLKKEFKDLFAMASLRGILSDQQLFNGREFISTF